MFAHKGQESAASSPTAARSTTTAPSGAARAGRHRGGRLRHRRVTPLRAVLAAGAVGVLTVAALAQARPAASRADTVGQWSAQIAQGGPFFQVTADFTVPAPNCPPASPGVPATGAGLGVAPGGSQRTDYWVGLQSLAVSAIIQAGFLVNCSAGSPSYAAITSDTSGNFTNLQGPVQAFDSIGLDINCAGGCVANINDMTQGWTQAVPFFVPAGFSATIAAVGSESFSGGVPSSPVIVDNATVNGQPLGQASPQAMIEDPSIYGGTADLVPNPLDPSGENFSFAWITL
jgi:hypothetical protein